MIRPRPLRRGDRVVVVSPSGPVDPELLAGGTRWLRGLGLEVEVAAHALTRAPDTAFLAGRDADRAADLAAAWSDPGVAAVLCARGGYGAARLLEHLDLASMAARQDPPWLVGSSDVTALHAAVGRRLGVATVFGPMVATEVLGGDRADRGSRTGLATVLFGADPTGGCGGLPPGRVLVDGHASGPLVGGTLTLLAAAAGTPWAGRAAGAVALLEDVAEEPYRLDRMVTQLLQSGWFEGVVGVGLGSWTHCGPEAEAVVAARLSALGVPVVAGLPIGHGRPQLSVVLGGRVVLGEGEG